MNDFYPGMKVTLNGAYGVVTAHCLESNGSYTIEGELHQGIPCKLYGLIRWDTATTDDFEDWTGICGSFFDIGGREIEHTYQFQFINDDGSLKAP